MRSWLHNRRLRRLVLLTGVTLAVLTGCNERDTLLKGFGDASSTAATTLVGALFERLTGPAPGSLGVL